MQGFACGNNLLVPAHALLDFIPRYSQISKAELRHGNENVWVSSWACIVFGGMSAIKGPLFTLIVKLLCLYQITVTAIPKYRDINCFWKTYLGSKYNGHQDRPVWCCYRTFCLERAKCLKSTRTGSWPLRITQRLRKEQTSSLCIISIRWNRAAIYWITFCALRRTK